MLPLRTEYLDIAVSEMSSAIDFGYEFVWMDHRMNAFHFERTTLASSPKYIFTYINICNITL